MGSQHRSRPSNQPTLATRWRFEPVPAIRTRSRHPIARVRISHNKTAYLTNQSIDYAISFTVLTMRSSTSYGMSSEMSGLLYRSRGLQEKDFWAKDNRSEAEEFQWTRCAVKHELLPNSEPNLVKFKHLARDLAAKRLSLEEEAYERPSPRQHCHGRRWRPAVQQAQRLATRPLRELQKTASGMGSGQRLKWTMRTVSP